MKTQTTQNRKSYIFSLCNNGKSEIYKILGVHPRPIQNAQVHDILEAIIEEAENGQRI